MAKLSFEFNEEIIKEWEQQLGKRYKNWSNEDKKNFLLYIVTSQIPILDSCVESSYGLSSLQQTPFGQKINELIDMGFELVLNNDFKYVGYTGSNGTEAKEMVLFHQSGLLYYATSIQEKRSIGRETDVKRSELYFQASSIKKEASFEAKLIAQRGSGIQYEDGTVFKSYTNIKNEEIKTMLENFNFLSTWTSNQSLMLLNEEDVYQNVNGRVIPRSEIDEKIIHMNKIRQLPEEIQSYLGYEEVQNVKK